MVASSVAPMGGDGTEVADLDISSPCSCTSDEDVTAMGRMVLFGGYSGGIILWLLL